MFAATENCNKELPLIAKPEILTNSRMGCETANTRLLRITSTTALDPAKACNLLGSKPQDHNLATLSYSNNGIHCRVGRSMEFNFCLIGVTSNRCCYQTISHFNSDLKQKGIYIIIKWVWILFHWVNEGQALYHFLMTGISAQSRIWKSSWMVNTEWNVCVIFP